MAPMQRDRRVARSWSGPEELEGRALLSVAASAVDRVITAIYEHVLHRGPTARELRLRECQIEAGVRPTGLAARLLASPAYRATHRGATAFVEGLYRDVLGREPDPADERPWVGALGRGRISRGEMARAFLAAPGSFLGSSPGAQGGITGVSATNGWSSGTRGSTVAFAAGVFNRGTPPTVVTITVSAAGRYVLDQGNGSFVGNNSGQTWRGFAITILPSSTAGPTFVSSVDATGHLPTVGLSATTVSFSGGTVPSGPDVIANGFQPRTMIAATRAGTIVLQETPVVS